MRADLQNLPAGMGKPWPSTGFAGSAQGDHSTALMERGEVYDFIREHRITGFATIAGDLHSFWAGLAAKSLPPERFEPVGTSFVVGSISAPGLVEALEHVLPKDHPLRALYLVDRGGGQKPEPTVNMLLRHGVRSCLEYQKSGDAIKARALSNPELSPHLSFVDMAGHGYAVVRASGTEMVTEFVCIPRPLERSTSAEGGPILYRVSFTTRTWRADEPPKLQMKVTQGDPRLSI
jgi:alkaline phosphatase D